MPAAEKQDDEQEAGRDHVRVLTQEEHAKLKRAVFRVVTADQFLLRLRKIKRQSVALGENTYQKEKERQRLIPDVPGENTPRRLGGDDLLQVQRTGEEHHAQDRHPHRDLVADELSARAQCSEKAVFAVGSPAS